MLLFLANNQLKVSNKASSVTKAYINECPKVVTKAYMTVDLAYIYNYASLCVCVCVNSN